MVNNKIFFCFDYETVEASFALLQKAFSPVTIHCTDCLKVQRNFREAFRGYMIGQGLFPDSKGHMMGRAPITTVEREMEKSGPDFEITFSHEQVEVYGTISKKCFVANILDISTESLERFIEKIQSAFHITEWEAIDLDTSKGKRMRFYEDLSRRLEAGEFEGGERCSFYHPPEENASHD